LCGRQAQAQKWGVGFFIKFFLVITEYGAKVNSKFELLVNFRKKIIQRYFYLSFKYVLKGEGSPGGLYCEVSALLSLDRNLGYEGGGIIFFSEFM